MNIKPVTSPHQIPVNGTPESVRTAKAVAAFNAGKSSYDAPAPSTGQAQETPVANPNRVSPEELSAIRPSQVDRPAEVEATEPEVKAEPQKTEENPELKRQFARLAQQERQLRAKQRQQQEELQKRQSELDSKENAIKAKEQEYSQGWISKDQLRQETLRILAETGVDSSKLYNDLTEQTLNPVDPRLEGVISSLKAEIKGLKASIEEGKAQQSEQQQQAYKAAVKQIETDVRATVQNDPNYETIKVTRSITDVVELIEETYKKDGILMSVEEACNEVEKYLVEEATKLTRIGKIRRQLEQSGQTKSSEMKTQPKPQQSQPSPMKTLTNAAASTRKLSNKERAILAFKGQLGER